MKAKLELDEKEIHEAVRRYVEAQGWTVSATFLSVKRGYEGDQREPGTPDTISIICNVEPKVPPLPSAYENR